MHVNRFAPIIALSVALSSCFPLVAGSDRPSELLGQRLRLTFLHTSDLHSRLLPYDFAPLKTDTDLGLIPEAGPFGGATRLGALLKRERKKAGRVLHVDSGDSFQGAPIFNGFGGEAEYRFLTRVGLDAAVIGNHEFDAGALSFTQKARDFANFPLLACNYQWDDYRSNPGSSNQSALSTQPYAIKDLGGVRVGIVGLANISSLNSLVEGGNSVQATPLEGNEAVRGYVELLKPLVDLVLVVSHAGLTEDQDLINGYEAFYEYGRARFFLERAANPWKVLEWFGPEGDEKSVVRVLIPGVSGIDAILGGHLHVVLNPPQLLTDPQGRRVILSHGGAFSKYLSRLDVVLQMPQALGEPNGAEILSHDYKVFPIDGLWCDEALRSYYQSKFWNPGEFKKDPQVIAGLQRCVEVEDKEITQLMQPYILSLDVNFNLQALFGYAPRDIARRNNSTGGDSPLGNMTADSMRKRKRVEAELAVTNSLGIRDNLYAGPLTIESMFNVFPFENTINVMYLSGSELQEMFDFITERSATRGCVAQAQVSGVRFTMDCAQAQLNAQRAPCKVGNGAVECGSDDRTGRAPWQCIADDQTGGRCFANSGTNIVINGQPLAPNTTYRVAVNDYIAKGGSGFRVLKRNTTRIETGIPLRDSLIGYVQGFCSCEDLFANQRDEKGNLIGKLKQTCGNLIDGVWTVDPIEIASCNATRDFAVALNKDPGNGCSCQKAFRGDLSVCGPTAEALATAAAACVATLPPGPLLGACTCRDALAGNSTCARLTNTLRAFCESPTAIAVAVGAEDNRIVRRVK